MVREVEAVRFAGRVALVTGSSRGIGRALTLLLAREGASVVVHYRRATEAAEEVAALARQAGVEAWCHRADIESVDEIHALFDAIAQRHGRLDVFVANAAAAAFKPAMQIQPHHLERTFNTNVRAFVLGAQRAAAMMGPGGRILAITSYGSLRAFPTYGNLGAAKAAIEAWVRYFAQELGPRDINVNALCAGIVDTDSAAFLFGRAPLPAADEIAPMIPKQRVASPEEIARAAAFLISPDASYVTGATLICDGGLTAVAPPYVPT